MPEMWPVVINTIYFHVLFYDKIYQ